MDFSNIDSRLDLDNFMRDVQKNFPKNDDDYFMYMRGKHSTREHCIMSASNDMNIGYGIWVWAMDEDVVLESFMMCMAALIRDGKVNKEIMIEMIEAQEKIKNQ